MAFKARIARLEKDAGVGMAERYRIIRELIQQSPNIDTGHTLGEPCDIGDAEVGAALQNLVNLPQEEFDQAIADWKAFIDNYDATRRE